MRALVPVLYFTESCGFMCAFPKFKLASKIAFLPKLPDPANIWYF